MLSYSVVNLACHPLDDQSSREQHTERVPRVCEQPRKLTLSDLLSIVMGFAIAFTFCPIAPLLDVLTYWDWSDGTLAVWLKQVTIPIMHLAVWLGFTTAVAVCVRRLQYKGMPRPAEWLAIFLSLWILHSKLPDINAAVNRIQRAIGSFETMADFPFAQWRWRIAGAATVFCFAASFLLYAARNSLPPWLRTVAVISIVLVFLWGPSAVFSTRMASWFPDSILFSLTGWSYRIMRATLYGLGSLPNTFLFGVPAAATWLSWRSRRSRRWIWTEWTGMIAFGLFALATLLIHTMGNYSGPSKEWVSATIVTWPGLIVVIALSFPIARLFLARPHHIGP